MTYSKIEVQYAPDEADKQRSKENDRFKGKQLQWPPNCSDESSRSWQPILLGIGVQSLYSSLLSQFTSLTSEQSWRVRLWY